MTSYFKDARTAEDLKGLYHTWCKRLHPDNGGNAAEFIRMRAEFKALWTKLQDVHATIVAAIDKSTGNCYDWLRLVYGYTTTSAQHIRKFATQYGNGVVKSWKER